MTSKNTSRPPGRRIIRVGAIVLASLLAVVLASALTNAALTASERATIAPYGQKVTIGGGHVNVFRNGGTGPTLVMLSGFGTAAPVVDFAPLIPADIPVLEFLSTDSVATIPGWLAHHQAELSGVTTHDLEIVEGAHYLQWTQAPLLAQKITEFVAANVAS